MQRVPLATARRLSQSHPHAMLPCPHCGASVRGENLERHLERTHAGAPEPGLPLRGKDRASLRELGIVGVVTTILGAAAIGATGMTPTDGSVAAVTAAVLAFLALVIAAAYPALPARLELDGSRVTLRYGFGLRSRTLTGVERIEVGRARTMRETFPTQSEANQGAVEVDDGTYLRLVHGARRITVGCSKGTAFRKHWSPEKWTSGAPTRRLDVSVDRAAMATLEWHLVEMGLLEPRYSP